MTAHTPGPWQVYQLNDNKRVVDTRGNVVTEWAQNNASLIAAAPDLLKELRTLVVALQSSLNNGDVRLPGIATLNAAWQAIAKAEGR